MGRQGREGEGSQAGEVGLEIASGTEAPRLHLSLCGWTCRSAPGMWILEAVMACFSLSCGVYGLLWFWHTGPVSASPQRHGSGMKVPCGTGVCSQSLRAVWVLSLVTFPESLSSEDVAKMWLPCSPVCWYKAANILFQVGLMMKMCWTLERDVLSTQSSLQA